MDIRDHLTEGASAQDLARAVLERLRVLRDELSEEAERTLASWTHVVDRPEFQPSVDNLAHYLALRKRDLTLEQQALSLLGLSSLGRSEGHVMATLDTVIAALAALAGEGPLVGTLSPQLTAGRVRTQERADAILGEEPLHASTRILVTLPSDAATDPALVAGIVEAGATSVRINCAHDGPEAWAAMIANTRAAGAAAGRRVPVLMDLAGPKVRTLQVHGPADYVAREKKSKLKAWKKEGIDPASLGARLMVGDRMVIQTRFKPRKDAFTATLSHPELLAQMKPGSTVWFDDGKIGARVTEATAEEITLEVEQAPAKGVRLGPEKGVNLPGVAVDIPALTDADYVALDFVVGHADMIGFSFVQTARDVRALQAAVAKRLAPGAAMPALVLKIETDLAVRNLPRLIVQAGGTMPVAVMIARGDLAVEIGLERMSEIQEEILWLCEAAEVPVIWATQVLEGLAKDRKASRAETTDAAMGQRAECVMLNKGPYIVEAISFLARVLRRMDRHQSKKSPRLAPLRAWLDVAGL